MGKDDSKKPLLLLILLTLAAVIGTTATVYHLTTVEQRVTVDIHPATLNLKSNGTWITAYIELPEGYEVSDINITTVQLETIPAAWGNVEGNKLMVKFDRPAVIDYIISKLYHMAPPPAKNYVELTITCELFDGTLFKGSDTIKLVE